MSNCYHCDLPIPPGAYYPVEIDGKTRDMCCPGCQAVANAIVENGLTDFYKYRTEKSASPQQSMDELYETLSLYDKPELQKDFVKQESGSLRQASLILEGIVCAACVWLNERHVMALPGVSEFRINYSSRRATVKWDDEKIHLSDILKAITAIGYVAHPFDAGRQEKLHKRERSRALRGLAVAGLGAMQVMMLAVAMYAGESQGMDEGLRHFMRWVSLLITIPVAFYSARPFFKSAWRDLKYRQLGMDVPVSLAIGIAFIASCWATVMNQGEVYFDSVTMFTFFLLTGRYLEMMARHRAGQASEELVRLLPVTATRVCDGEEEVVSANELQVGDLVMIKPGETVPADGVIVEGSSSIDESLLTGESVPVSRGSNNQIIGGSINIESTILMRIEKIGEDTVLSSIVRLLDRAQTEKPRLAQLADRVAGWFVAVILLLATAIAWYWWQHDPANAFWISLSVLVVTCPCALSLATPAALVAATGQLTRMGLLTTRGHALETLARATHIVFDKTGTLTYGRLQLEDVINLHCQSREQALQIAAALESGSEHPIAKAIIEAAPQEKLQVTDISALTGRGMQARIDGKLYRIGKPDFVAELASSMEHHEAFRQQKTVVALADEQRILALFVMADVVREDAAETIQSLSKLGLKVTLLSGDQAPVVNNVAQRLGIENAHAGMLPDEKLEQIQAMQQAGDIVAMVGDGVNDAPVLAAAQVSIAMGGGSQIAHASADMVLLSESLPHIVDGVGMARRSLAIIRQNLIWALVYNLLALPLAAMGMIAPWMAAIGMSASSLVVVLNALRLTR
jgi:Cu2+-exporting ATPase